MSLKTLSRICGQERTDYILEVIHLRIGTWEFVLQDSSTLQDLDLRCQSRLWILRLKTSETLSAQK